MKPMGHAVVDELGAAYVLGALDVEEARAVAAHLASCDEPHTELRAALGADEVLAMSLDPIQPSTALRDRVMASIERAPQERTSAARSAVTRPYAAQTARRGWLDWLSPQVARPLAVAAVVAALVVGAWGVSLQSQLAQRDRALRAVASAIAAGETAFRVEGDAGRGYVVETPGQGAALVVANLGALQADQLYELWLLDAAGTPVAVGTFRPEGSEIQVVEVERDLSGYTTFAVTVEAKRMDAPSGAPVMAGAIES
jgi:anti-sigma-K factor RskA